MQMIFMNLEVVLVNKLIHSSFCPQELKSTSSLFLTNATCYYLRNLPSTMQGSSQVANIKGEQEAQQVMSPMSTNQ
jgi:hypothetical protein